jgi:hypothetical protein
LALRIIIEFQAAECKIPNDILQKWTYATYKLIAKEICPMSNYSVPT